jgi:hypothetical protein
MLISVAGRVAQAFIAETEGVYRPSWTINEPLVQAELPVHLMSKLPFWSLPK